VGRVAVQAVAGSAGGGERGAVLLVAGAGLLERRQSAGVQRGDLDWRAFLQRLDGGLGEGDRAGHEGDETGDTDGAGVAHCGTPGSWIAAGLPRPQGPRLSRCAAWTVKPPAGGRLRGGAP